MKSWRPQGARSGCREHILGEKHTDQLRRLSRYSAEEMTVAWTEGIAVKWCEAVRSGFILDADWRDV